LRLYYGLDLLLSKLSKAQVSESSMAAQTFIASVNGTNAIHLSEKLTFNVIESLNFVNFELLNAIDSSV
jgi:hypothetical protein